MRVTNIVLNEAPKLASHVDVRLLYMLYYTFFDELITQAALLVVASNTFDNLNH